MSSLKFSAVALLAALTLSACGFQPIAKPLQDNGETKIKFKSILVSSENRQLAYRTEQELLKYLSNDARADQTLTLRIDVETNALAIDQDDAITRRNITAIGAYIITRPGTSPLRGIAQSTTAVNTTTDQFSTTISTRDAEARLGRDLGQRIVRILRIDMTKN